MLIKTCLIKKRKQILLSMTMLFLLMRAILFMVKKTNKLLMNIAIILGVNNHILFLTEHNFFLFRLKKWSS